MNIWLEGEPEKREWLYRIARAGFGVLGVYGLINGNEMAAWLVLAGALFSVPKRNIQY